MKRKLLLILHIVVIVLFSGCTPTIKKSAPLSSTPNLTEPISTQGRLSIETPASILAEIPSPIYIQSLNTHLTANVSIVDDFDHYQSNNHSPNFSIIFPANWEYGWNTGSRFLLFEISSGNLNKASAPSNPSTVLRINRYSASNPDPKDLTGAQLADEPQFNSWIDTAESVIEYPTPTTINGHEAARSVYITRDKRKNIVVLITEGSMVLVVWSSASVEDQIEQIPVLEKIINSIEIIPSLYE